VINGGLEVHEAVIGDEDVQAAWEAAEAATIGAPPGPTPTVSVPPDVSGVRIVVRSGERVDLRWTVPADVLTASTPAAWTVGCHIPGHLANGMSIPIRWIAEPAA
jgi:FtsP/CotA-like multicopper oxidase with cupredoxin domain